MRLRRREMIAGKTKPEEVLLVKLRKEPFSVYFQWQGPEGKGREVVYVKGQHGNLIHTLTAAGDVPLMPGGQIFKVSPDSALVRGRSRYPITEAGIGTIIDRFGQLVGTLEKGTDEGSVKYMGQLKRPEFDTPLEGVLQVLPPGPDPSLARGGQRLWFFDAVHHLPALLITQDDAGRDVEYYCHDQFQLSLRLTDDDFDPAKLWKR
jgi:hypothetical protein